MDLGAKKTMERSGANGRRPASGRRPRSNGVCPVPAGSGGVITPTGQRWFRDLPRWMQDKLKAGDAAVSLKGNAHAAS